MQLIQAFTRESGESRRMIATRMGISRDPVFSDSIRLLLETGDDRDATVAIRALAQIGGELNFRILTDLMNNGGWPDSLRGEAAMAMIASRENTLVLAAITGLGVIGGEENADRLAAIMHDDRLDDTVRLQAALGLGIIGTEYAGRRMADAFHVFEDPVVHAQLLESLGRFPFEMIETTWRNYLAAPQIPGELRAAAAEALAASTSDALPYLLEIAAMDEDPEVREMAAWSIASLSANENSGSRLAEMARHEPEADVRRRLYEAQLVQASIPADSLFPLIMAETDVAARVAGFNSLGDAVRRLGQGGLAQEFDRTIIPELIEIATSEETLNLRMRAVFALRRAQTDTSYQALHEISKSHDPRVARNAMNGLLQRNNNR